MIDIKDVQYQWLITFFNKKSAGGFAKNEIIQNKEFDGELQKPIIRKSKQGKVYSLFIDIIWGANLADLQCLSKKFIFYYVFFDIFSKYAWVITLKDKKCITITNAFQKIINESK